MPASDSPGASSLPAAAALAVLIVTLGARLLSIGAYPLADTTEARYADIARMMAETGNWVTPFFDEGVVFWGKPPLYAWLSAASFEVLGTSEFAARLPSFALALGTLALVYLLGRREMGRDRAILAATVLATSGVFAFISGAVMTDPGLLLSVTLVMVSCWIAMTTAPEIPSPWRWLFFVGLGLGLLAKGPIALLLTGLPVFLWCLPAARLPRLWRALPWGRGLALMLLIAAPWYVWAELRTPGFLEYFFVGEHWLRFTDSTWAGDRYGTVHQSARGAIWWSWLQAAAPWSLVLLALFGTGQLSRARRRDASEGWRMFLWLWLLAPMLVFSLAGSVLLSYVLPGVPGLALLIAAAWPEREPWAHRTLLPALLAPVAVVGLVVVSNLGGSKRADRQLVHDFEAARVDRKGDLVYWKSRTFSGRFYSAGRARLAATEGAVDALLDDDRRDFLVTRERDLSRFSERVQLGFAEHVAYDANTLWLERDASSAAQDGAPPPADR